MIVGPLRGYEKAYLILNDIEAESLNRAGTAGVNCTHIQDNTDDPSADSGSVDVSLNTGENLTTNWLMWLFPSLQKPPSYEEAMDLFGVSEPFSRGELNARLEQLCDTPRSNRQYAWIVNRAYTLLSNRAVH